MKSMKAILASFAIAFAVTAGSLGPQHVIGEEGSEGCGTVQDWRRPIILLPDAEGHAFGQDVSELGWVKEGEAEPNHKNKHNELSAGYHTHDQASDAMYRRQLNRAASLTNPGEAWL